MGAICPRIASALCLALLVAASPDALAQEEAMSLDEMADSAEQWAKENLDDETLAALGDLDREKVKKFFADIKREFQATLGRRPNQVAEILRRAQFRVNGLVPSLRRSDSPGAAGVTRASYGRVVPSLAKTPANRVNRRQVEDIEAHGSYVRQPFLKVLEGAMTPGH